MAFSDSEEYKEYRRKNRSAREEYREYLEDEEDYEEYARARDRENTGRSGKRAAGPAGRAGSGSQRGGAVRTGRPVSRETGRPQAAGNGRQQRTGSRENRQGSVGTWDGSRENRQVSADPRDGSRGNRQGFVDPREANPAGKRRRKKRGILGILLRLFVIVLLSKKGVKAMSLKRSTITDAGLEVRTAMGPEEQGLGAGPGSSHSAHVGCGGWGGEDEAFTPKRQSG